MATIEWEGQARLKRIHDVTIKALNISARKLIGRSLDQRVSTFSRTCGTQQDWEGLAELMGLDYDEIQVLSNKEEKTVALIQYWSQKPDTTIGRFIKHIEELERFDILENSILQDRMVADVESYHTRQEDLRGEAGLNDPPIQVDEVNSTLSADRLGAPVDATWDTEFKNITIGEVQTSVPEYFDAFVCHSKEDMEFVKQLLDMLEGHHGLKLCVVDRDLTLGTAEYTIVSHLMSQRCKKVIIIVSPRFMRCSACDFMTKFAQSLDPGARSKKLIPIVIQQPCAVPEILRFITMVDYTRCELVEWFWWRVACSLKESSFIDPDTLYGKQMVKTGKLHVRTSVPRQENNIDTASRCQPSDMGVDAQYAQPIGRQTPPTSTQAPPTENNAPPTTFQARPPMSQEPAIFGVNQISGSVGGVGPTGSDPSMSYGMPCSPWMAGYMPVSVETQYNTVSVNHSMTEPISTNQISPFRHMTTTMPSVANSTEPLFPTGEKTKKSNTKKKKVPTAALR